MSITAGRLTTLRKMPYEDYLQTPEWQKRRKGAVAFAGERCQLCNSEEKPLHVHHRTYENLGAEMVQDLVALCKDCHEKHHDSATKIAAPNEPKDPRRPIFPRPNPAKQREHSDAVTSYAIRGDIEPMRRWCQKWNKSFLLQEGILLRTPPATWDSVRLAHQRHQDKVNG